MPVQRIFSLYHFALPEIAHHMMSIDGFNEEKVRQSLRGEYYKKFERLCSANTRRRQGHPFEKKYPFEKELQVSVSRIMQGWRTPRKVFAANESYPDLAILEPFPFTVVFDAKFFKDESPTSAERALVTGVYELVFYRGLPPASDDAKGYDFGCLLAYDASDGAFLQQAWESVASKRLFWEGAHVFVMIVRGKSPSALTGPIPSIPAE